MQLTDSHCHLDLMDLSPFEGSLSQVLELAAAEGVFYFLCPGVVLSDLPAMLEKITPFPNVWAGVGLHPNETTADEPDAARLAELAAANPKIVAIGETGLDYYRTMEDTALQRVRFRAHVQAARATHKPLIIHTRQACKDTLAIMHEENAHEVGGVMHCFTEDLSMARSAIEMGFYISFSGIVTFPNAKTVQAVAQEIPLERMLIETDAPWLAPVPFRGKANQPAYVRHVAECIARLRGVSMEEIAEQTTRNFLTLFLPDR